MVRRYNSVVEIAEVARTVKPSYTSVDVEWTGGLTHFGVIDKCYNGDEKLVPIAEKLISKIDATVEVPHREWIPSVYGAYPIVADYLAGNPEPMRRITMNPSETQPINIYVGTSSSGGFSSAQLMTRGVAILALVMKLQEVRPVTLYVMGEQFGKHDGEYLQVVQVGSQPVNLSVACFVLTNAGFDRHFMHSIATAKAGYTGAWPRLYNGCSNSWIEHLKEVLGMTDTDLYIRGAYSKDADLTLMLENPVEWVNGQVKRLVV